VRVVTGFLVLVSMLADGGAVAVAIRAPAVPAADRDIGEDRPRGFRRGGGLRCRAAGRGHLRARAEMARGDSALPGGVRERGRVTGGIGIGVQVLRIVGAQERIRGDERAGGGLVLAGTEINEVG
jgi:hypothetical protein